MHTKFTIYYATELGGKWTIWSEGIDEDTAGYQATELLKNGTAVSIRIEITD